MSVPTEVLFSVADQEGLLWDFVDLPQRIYGRFYEKLGFIAINIMLRCESLLFRETFAEELGHAETLGFNQHSTNPTYLGRILDNKIERPALIWAVNFLIDTCEYLSLCAQLSDCSSEGRAYQLAEHFGVTPRFIKLKERIINEKGYLLNWNIDNGNYPCWLREQSYCRTGRGTLSCP